MKETNSLISSAGGRNLSRSYGMTPSDVTVAERRRGATNSGDNNGKTAGDKSKEPGTNSGEIVQAEQVGLVFKNF